MVGVVGSVEASGMRRVRAMTALTITTATAVGTGTMMMVKPTNATEDIIIAVAGVKTFDFLDTLR